MRNRSAPPTSVTPVLSYPNVAAAVDWLTRTFGFVEHVRISDHRAQLGFGDGSLIVADVSQGRSAPTPASDTHSIMVRVDDVDEHYQRVSAAGAQVVSTPGIMCTASDSTPSSTSPGTDGPSPSPSRT